jgi:hypothetical protein
MKFAKEFASANIDDHGELRKPSLGHGEQIGDWAKHLWWQVVYYIPAKVFESIAYGRPTRA